MTSEKTLKLRYYIPTLTILLASSGFMAHQLAQTMPVSLPASFIHLAKTSTPQTPIATANTSLHEISSIDTTTAAYALATNMIAERDAALTPMPSEASFTSNNPAQERNKTFLQETNEEDRTKEGVTLASFYKTAKPEVLAGPLELKIQNGQTVAGQLSEFGVPSTQAYEISKALGKYHDLRRIRAGQALTVEYDTAADETGNLIKNVSKMTMPVSPAKEIVVYSEDDSYKAKEITKKINTTITANRTKLKYSLYGSAAKAGIPDQVIADMIKIFSWSVDFQRDIRSGDEIEILYETKATEDGDFMGYGDVLYARLVTGGQDLSLYRYTTKDGRSDYFDPKGRSIKRTLMKTPIDGARMSSGFGMRRHPVLGYNKMHKGVDFAAPTGTPIYAAGDGIIEKAGRNGSFGNYVRIRHTSQLKTAYAHMQKIKSGIRAGSRVKQGQVIGYVGTTGRSTGPHLHYEVMLNDKQVNPRGVNVPTGEILTGSELKRFQNQRVQFDQKFAQQTEPKKYAQAQTSSSDLTDVQ